MIDKKQFFANKLLKIEMGHVIMDL